MSTIVRIGPAAVYVSLQTSSEIMATNPDVIRRLADEGKIRVRQYTGTRRRYALEDLLKLVTEATTAEAAPVG